MRLVRGSSPAVVSPSAVTRSHLHLWTLSDGTGLHAPYAELAVDQETLRLCCHLCGKWFVSLGSHVRAHGYTADSYRQAMGLCNTTALTCSALSASIAGRQSVGYRRDPQVRENLREGRAARKTQNSAPTVLDAPTTPPVSSAVIGEPAQRVRRRRAALAAGRATVAARREQALAVTLAERGYDCLHEFLRQSYAEGGDLESLARTTGLGRVRLRREVEMAGITVERSVRTLRGQSGPAPTTTMLPPPGGWGATTCSPGSVNVETKVGRWLAWHGRSDTAPRG